MTVTEPAKSSDEREKRLSRGQGISFGEANQQIFNVLNFNSIDPPACGDISPIQLSGLQDKRKAW